MKKITALSNPLIKDIVTLHSSKGRAHHNLYIAQGTRTIYAIVDAGFTPRYVLATAVMLDRAVALTLTMDTELIEVSDSVMDKISTASQASGLLAVFAIPTAPLTPITTPGIVLASINDPGNMGTLIRTAAALNIKEVIIIDGVDCWSPKVVQASAGTVAQVAVRQLSWPALIKQTTDLSLCALVVKDGKSPQDINLHHQLLVIGNEAHGISNEWLSDCKEKMTLPMPGNTESLNAAVAGSIAMYLSVGAQSK